jgi:hypothetical protein
MRSQAQPGNEKCGTIFTEFSSFEAASEPTPSAARLLCSARNDILKPPVTEGFLANDLFYIFLT